MGRVLKVCKVQWSNQSEEDATWENEDQMKIDFPRLFEVYHNHVRSHQGCHMKFGYALEFKVSVFKTVVSLNLRGVVPAAKSFCS